ncbi:hypothetical protein BH09VER1_BH09VER1_30070 [soil metagenome]
MNLPDVLLLALLYAAVALAEEPPLSHVASLPTPPAQSQPWQAPESKLPPQALRSFQNLFDAGFADPRGCEYREIVLPFSKQTDWGGPATPPTDHGWVLPARPGDAQRYAICWNGLVYPIVSIGAPADVDQDMAQAFANLPPPSTYGRYDPTRAVHDENLAYDQISLSKVPLLLRLGKVELAEKFWRQWDPSLSGTIVNSNGSPIGTPATLLSEWLWANYQRALQAHARGDFGLAVAYLRAIPGPETEAGKVATQWQIAAQSSAILADDERRLREAASPSDASKYPEAIPDKSARIAALIHDLENVRARVFVSNGYLEFSRASAVQALAREGDDAVGPLLECLAHDHRLTCSIDQTGSWAPSIEFGHARLVGVDEPALAALQDIFKSRARFSNLNEHDANSTPSNPTLDRVALADQIRAYWEKNRGKSLPQLWYDTLADDHASPQAWLEAANYLTLPQSAVISGSWIMFFPTKAGSVDNAGPPALKGDSLRSTKDPSVSDLLVRRLKVLFALRGEPDQYASQYQAGRLVDALAKWDGKNQIEVLRWYCGELQKMVDAQTERDGTSGISDLVKTYLARVEAGDPQALPEYADWVRRTSTSMLAKLKNGDGASATFLSPVWSYPEDPAMSGLAKWLFADSASPWLPGPSNSKSNWVASSASLPLVALPAFRALVLQQLQNKEVVGTAEITPARNVTLHFPSSGGSFQSNDPDLPDAPAKYDLRTCDMIAHKVSQIRGAPRFEPYWPTERRDAAAQEIAQFLQRYGDRLAHRTTSQESSSSDLALHIQPLGYPATRSDVEAGLAVFSLEGKGERKLLPLPPRQARWITLKDYPETLSYYDSATRKTVVTQSFDQLTDVRQAEAVLIDGKWQPYYGLVGKHFLSAAPGSEIEFSGLYGETQDGWSIGVDLSINGTFGTEWPQLQAKADDPIVATISVENTRGIERTFSVASHPIGPTTAGALGLDIHLEYSPLPHDSIYAYFGSPRPEWETIAGPTTLPVDLLLTNATLPTLEKRALLTFDVTSVFHPQRPGTYRLVVKFRKDGLLGSELSPPFRLFEITR